MEREQRVARFKLKCKRGKKCLKKMEERKCRGSVGGKRRDMRACVERMFRLRVRKCITG